MLLLFTFNLIFLSVVQFLYTTTAEEVYQSTESRDTLLRDILNNYNPSIIPTPDKNKPVMLFVNIEVQHFDFLERTGAFHLVGLLHVKWHDPNLVWNPQSYGNRSHIIVKQRYIWIPDLEFYDNPGDKFIRMHHNGLVSVKNDGVVFWSNFVEVNIFCSRDMQNWPYDKHDCTAVLGSWTLDASKINFTPLELNRSMTFRSVDTKNMEYKITNFNASRSISYYYQRNYYYEDVTMDYNITFERQSSSMVIFRAPALTVIVFTLISLKMDPNRTEKLWLNGLSFVLVSWQLIYFAKNIGHFHGTPNIVIFFSTSIVMVTIAQILAIFSLFATHSKFKGSLPLFLETFSYCSVNRYLVQIKSKTNDRSEINEQCEEVKLDDTSNLINRNLSTNDWLRIAKIFNILAFLVFSFIFFILTSVCFV